MTVIAFDGRYVAADKQATTSTGTKTCTRKLFTHGRKVLAFDGGPNHGMALVAWFRSGANPKDYPIDRNENTNANLYVFEQGTPVVLIYESHGTPFVGEGSLFASGSGGKFAMAAMHLGRSAKEAVRVASDLDAFCGMGVDVIDLLGLSDAVGTGDGAPAGPPGPGAAPTE